MNKQSFSNIFFFFLIGMSLLFVGSAAAADQSAGDPVKHFASKMDLPADSSYVQDEETDTVNRSDDEFLSSAEISLSSGLKAFFSFKPPSVKDFTEEQDIRYYRALFGLNIFF